MNHRTGLSRAGVFWLAIASLAFMAAGCTLFTTDSATLRISLASDTRARTLQPGVSLDVITYDIAGSNTTGDSFEATGIGATLFQKEGLTPGTWTVQATGRNQAGDAIAVSAPATVTLDIAETESLSLLCLPLEGNGTLSIELSWPAGSVTTPAIEATLTPRGGSAAPIAFTITGNAASHSSTSLQNGYYTLIVKLKDESLSGWLAWSKVETVLIVKGRTTSANWVLEEDEVDTPAPSGMALILASDTKKPIAISLSGQQSILEEGSTMTVSATGTPAPSSWQWYLDGDLLAGQTSSSTTVGSGLAAGRIHTLTVIGTTDDLEGSADIRFSVSAAGPAQGVSTLAGSGTDGAQDGTGTAATFFGAGAVAVDASGNLYVADTRNHKIRKVTPDGTVGTLAGSGLSGFADGTGSAASFNSPNGIAVDSSGNVYVADTNNHRIRKITPAGVVSTFAGSGSPGFAEGTGTAARFNSPWGIAIDDSGTLYVADSSNNRIRTISPAAEVGTLAEAGDGTSFNYPYGIAVDTAGNVYVADGFTHKISMIDYNGNVSTLAGSGSQGAVDAIGVEASFKNPSGLAVDSGGNIYVADKGNFKIRRIDANGNVTTYAGTGTQGWLDGPPAEAKFASPAGVAVDSSGILYVADGNRIRRIVP
jgi:sugar lactone lactonase YvrE